MWPNFMAKDQDLSSFLITYSKYLRNPTNSNEKVFETYQNVKQEIRDQLNAEAEAVQIILTGIDNDIYSTVDACLNACEMWKAIKRLKQGESINVQDLETNLFWEFGKFTSLDGESLESYYSRFYKMMNELTRNQCKVTNHQSNTSPDSYSAASHFRGVIDWYQSRGYKEPGVDGPPVMPEDPYAYVVAAFQALPPPDYVPGPGSQSRHHPHPFTYLMYRSQCTPRYISESDPGEDPENDNEDPDNDDEDPEEDPTDYPADHDDDEEEEEPSGDDADEEDEEQDKDDDDEEEEHPASADFIPPLPALRVTARISFRPQPPTLFFTKEDAERVDRPEVTMPPRKRLSIVHSPGYKAGKSSVAAAARPMKEDIRYGIRDTWIGPRDVAEEEALTTLEGVNTRVTELAAVVKALVDDSQYHYETGRLVDQEARFSREAWAHSMGLENGTKESGPKANYKAMIDQGVNTALAARDTNRTGDDSHTSGTSFRRTEHVTRECTYQDFMKCQPLYFKGTEGVVELTQWFERIEMIFRISNCLAENRIKFATCTLLVGALTWWNSHVRIVGNDAAYVMTWIELKKKMVDKYCPRNEMKKIEAEFWNLEVQGTDVTRYIGGLPDIIHGSVAVSKPKTMQEATEMATGLMDKKIHTYADRQAANKRKFKDTSWNNQGRQQPPKRQDVARAYATGSGNRQQYAGSRPLCPKCNFNHDGPCIPRCYKCNKIGHLARDCRSPTNANVANNQRGNEAGQKVTCYECGVQGHFKRYCPKLKNNNNNRGNQVGTGNAQARVYAVGNARTNADANTITDHDYAVELADGRIVGVNTGRETLIFYGDGSNQEHETPLNIISCARTQKYMLKGCQVFLVHVTTKEAEGKSEKKRLENVPIVRDFPEVARAPYRLAPPEMKELSEQLKELSDKGFIRPSSSPWGAL
nr:hypothetical protein [Tanacetum cinerariifolium]